jgi:hypothetical protein
LGQGHALPFFPLEANMADETTYNLPVYREVGTGKIRVKGAEKIEPVSESPADSAELAETINAILNLLTDAGINPEE